MMDQKRVTRMKVLMHQLGPLARMVNCEGLDQTFEILKKRFPALQIHEYPCGSTAEDWEVPRSWKCVSASMTSEDGEVIASSEESALFVAPYSEPVDDWFSKQEIEIHLRTRPDRPDAFALEHRNAYDHSLVDWGITLPHNRWESLPDRRYHVHIDVEWGNGSMKAAEWLIEGTRSEIVCINAHIDELCNDDLSGCLVGLEMMNALARGERPSYSYQLLLTPELIGTLFFVKNNPEKIKRTIGMLNLEALGDGDALCLKHSLAGVGYLDTVLGEALQDLDLEYKELGFFEGYGNDERVYEWPTRAIPSIALQRYPFERYHTSDDTPESIDFQLMETAVQVGLRFIQILEQDKIPVWNQTLTPWLTKRGLYFDSTKDPENFQKLNNTVLFNMDGSHSLLDLAQKAGLRFRDVKSYLDEYERQDCITYKNR